MTTPAKKVAPKPKRAKKVQAAVEGGRPVKNRVEVAPPEPGYQTRGKDARLIVIDSKPGTVGLTDKAKAYLHTIIALVTGVLATLNQVAGLVGWIPGYGEQAATTVTGLIAFLGIVLTALKSNEQWVDAL